MCAEIIRRSEDTFGLMADRYDVGFAQQLADQLEDIQEEEALRNADRIESNIEIVTEAA